MIAVVDYGMGNLHSVRHAIEYLGSEVRVVAEPNGLDECDKIILPGVGSFRAASRELRHRGFREALRGQVIERRKPLLGICLGMQLLAAEGDEDGPTEGLALIPGTVTRLRPSDQLPVPHIGFNAVECGDDRLFAGFNGATDFYFIHGYHFQCSDPDHVAATCDYGGRFTAAVRHGHIGGVQFHPEKSQTNGLRLLKNFLERL